MVASTATIEFKDTTLDLSLTDAGSDCCNHQYSIYAMTDASGTVCMEVRAFLNEGACDDKTTVEERKSCVRDKIDPYVSDWGCSATDVWEAIDRCYVPAGQSLPVFLYY